VHLEENFMNKAILAIAAATAIAAGTMTAPTAADARCNGCIVGGVAAGIIGAAAVGAAIANSQPRGGYVVYEGYDAPYPRRCRHGYWARQRLYDRYGEFVGWSKPHFICP
jgi:hypothetical protein